MYKIVYEKQSLKDIDRIKSAGLSNKAKKLIDIIKQDPFQNPPLYEQLKGNLQGFYSRRINIQHRLVYQVDETSFVENGVLYKGTVKIIRMWTHYEGL